MQGMRGSRSAVLQWVVVLVVGVLVVTIVLGLNLIPRLNAGQKVLDSARPAFDPDRVAGARAGINIISKDVDLADPIATPQGGAAAEVPKLVAFVSQQTGLSQAQVLAALQKNFPHTTALLQAIPLSAVTAELRGLWRVNQMLLEFQQQHQPAASATLDMDATLIETHKRDALFCYKHFKAYQPLNCWWAEQGAMLYSEFRDGNVPAGHEQLRVMQESLCHLPDGVKKVSLRSDTAGYQEDLLLYCGEGKDPRFGVVEFAIGADVTEAFRAAVLATSEDAWQPLIRQVDDKPQQTDQEWAEICYVPSWAGYSRKQADYRFLAVREPLRQLALGDEAQLPFPTQVFGHKGVHKLFGVVTNRKGPGDGVIWWLRERCGKSEEVHSAMKSDLAGGQMPSGLFGANAAWWALMILAFNLNAAMKRLALGERWATTRMKALRFHLIGLPGRVVSHARKLIIRLGGGAEALATLLDARRSIRALAQEPAG